MKKKESARFIRINIDNYFYLSVALKSKLSIIISVSNLV